jgi:pSer/pThr/pTyr-binding forkhead associated (FHA) protein
MMKIRVVAGLSRGMEFELSRPLMTIGRLGGDADIQINDPEVSRLHCSIEVRGDAIVLHDLQSKNGTFVEESQVLAARLSGMSQFRIGTSSLQVEILSESEKYAKV